MEDIVDLVPFARSIKGSPDITVLFRQCIVVRCSSSLRTRRRLVVCGEAQSVDRLTSLPPRMH